MSDGAHDLAVAGTVVAVLRDGSDLPAEHAPRPYLHPVRTLDGTVLTAVGPADHPWHAGLGVAVPDIDGRNCWGGPTYERDSGYVWRDDHGRVDVLRTTHRADGVGQQIVWRGPDGAVLLREERSLRTVETTGGWSATWSSTFHAPADRPVTLGSPGSHGRTGAGYGGLTWRFPACDDVHVRTTAGSGEAAVHGTRSPWVEWSARFAGRRATIRLEALDHDDPWFVRVAEYPAVGSALAWDAPRTVRPGSPLVRTFRIAVTDGRPASLDG